MSGAFLRCWQVPDLWRLRPDPPAPRSWPSSAGEDQGTSHPAARKRQAFATGRNEFQDRPPDGLELSELSGRIQVEIPAASIAAESSLFEYLGVASVGGADPGAVKRIPFEDLGTLCAGIRDRALQQ